MVAEEVDPLISIELFALPFRRHLIALNLIKIYVFYVILINIKRVLNSHAYFVALSRLMPDSFAAR